MPKPAPLPEIYFLGQRDAEEVEFILFKHWYMLAAPIVKAFAIIAATLFIPIWLHFIKFIFSYGILALIYYTWQVFWIGYMIYAYIRWSQDKFIVTNERVINIDQQSPVRRKVSEVELSRIENVTHEVNGFFPTLLNFGTVTIESGSLTLALRNVEDPAGIQEDITRMVKAKTAQKPMTAAALIELVKQSHSEGANPVQ